MLRRAARDPYARNGGACPLCEGAEGDILEAASDKLLASVAHACVEWHDNMAPGVRKRCLERLVLANFKCRDEPNPWVEGEGIIYAERRA